MWLCVDASNDLRNAQAFKQVIFFVTVHLYLNPWLQMNFTGGDILWMFFPVSFMLFAIENKQTLKKKTTSF